MSTSHSSGDLSHALRANKVPQVALGFWVVKVLSTTVGETGADYLAVNAGLGQGLTRLLMGSLLLAAWVWQMRQRRYQPWIYWLTVVLVSVVGTQITDWLTDGLGVSLYVSTAAFSLTLVAVFAIWYRREGTLSIDRVDRPAREAFYWLTVLCTFALGTAAGDLATEALGLGFVLGAVVFGLLIATTACAWQLSGGVDAVLAFWVCYVLTRPFGAALGDLLTQAPTYGGLGWGAVRTSAVFLAAIAVLVGLEQLGVRRVARRVGA